MNLEDLNLRTHEYQTDRVVLLPYVKSKFPPDLLARLHSRLIEDGTLETVFTGMRDARDFEQWNGYMSKQPIVLFVRKPDSIIGAGWVSEVQGVDNARKAAFGFWLYRSSWGTKEGHDLCRFALRWWFETFRIDILYATSLKTNRLAINFALRRFGFRKLCDLPMFFTQGKSLVDGTLICLKKTDFDVVYERWLSGRGMPLKPFEKRTAEAVDLSP